MNKKIVFTVLLALVACEDRRTVNGPDQIEDGVVVETLHLPGQSSTDISPGMTMNGDLTWSVHTTSFPERWNVVIKCQHGKFVLDSQRHEIARGVWEGVTVGDRVRITYHEVFVSIYEKGVEKSSQFEKYETTQVVRVK